MAYGVTPEGFVRPRLPEIRQKIIEDLRARLRAQSLPDDVETRPDSVTGLLIDTFADREAALWEMGEGVYYAMYPGSAFGVSLDRSVSFSGAKREGQEKSKCYVVLYGLQSTTVPDGAQIRNKSTQTIWRINGPVTVSALAASDVRIVPAVAVNTTYTITIDEVDFTYVSGAFDALADVLGGLVAALGASGYEISSNGASVRILVTNKTAVAFGLSPTLAFTGIGSTAIAETVDYVAELAEPGELDTIVTLVDGWTSVVNITASSVGGPAEIDSQLRSRYASGVYRLGAGTLPSIAPGIQERVQGIRAIKVYQNNTDDIDADGRLPHSVHVVVDGGIEDEIASALYAVVGGGIDTNGAVARVLETDEGNQTMRFDRPTLVYVWVKAVISLLPANEAAFPPDGFARVTTAIDDIGQTHQISQDVIVQRFYCGIYQTPGIAEVALTFAHSTDPAFVPSSGDYSDSNITIASSQRAVFDLSRTEVTG